MKGNYSDEDEGDAFEEEYIDDDYGGGDHKSK